MIKLNSKPKSIVGNRQVNESPARALPKQDQQVLAGVWTNDFGLEFNSIIKNHFSLINSTIFSD